MKDKQPVNISERSVALIGLAATGTKSIDACPSDAELTNYIEGHLKAKARKTVLIHINQCSTCREHWLEVSAYLNELNQNSSESSTARPGFFNWHSIQSLFSDWAVPAIPTTVVIVIILLVAGFWPGAYDFETEMEASYRTLMVEHATAVAEVIPALSVPSEGATFAFSESQTTPASRAFAAGLWTGKQRLRGNSVSQLPDLLVPIAPHDSWVDSPWKDYFAFGQWMVLVWTQSKIGQDDLPLAQRQNVILKTLLANFGELSESEEDAKQAIQAGIRIESLLARFEQGKPTDQTRDQLIRRLEISMQQLAR